MKTLLILFLSIILVEVHAQNSRRDGNWWMSKDARYKNIFVLGFFDGMELGNKFSYWPQIKDSTSDSCIEKTFESFHQYYSKYLDQVLNTQVSLGLDSLYSDFRNRRILINDGIWLVLNEISGLSKKEMDDLVINYRKSATK